MAEPDNSFASNAVPEVQNKTSKPPGILPKNAQTWIVLGVAVLMILVISFSNAGAPKPKPHEDAKRQNGSAATQNRIDEYRAMVDQEARRLAAERQKAEQARAQVQAAANAMQMQQPAYNPYTSSQPAPYQPTGAVQVPSPEEVQRAALENDRRKREYASLFSSNVALSFRTQASRENAGSAPWTLQDTTSNTERSTVPIAAVGSAPNSATPSSLQRSAEPGAPDENTGRTGVDGSADAGSPNRRSVDPDLQKATGRKYRLFEGTILECVLTNRLDGSFSGPVNVMLTSAVYTHDGRSVLIPQGTRILGEVQRVNSFGQQRLAVFFHRMIMPDGYSISLDKFQGLNQIGETGLRDKVNRHYLQTFGACLAIGAVAGLAQANTQYGIGVSGTDVYRQGVSSSISQSSLRILDRYLNILPTFTVREGHRIKVHLTNDVLLPTYENHRLESDL